MASSRKPIPGTCHSPSFSRFLPEVKSIHQCKRARWLDPKRILPSGFQSSNPLSAQLIAA
eukprot:scaffold2914_cov66-Attheya_sp.AAC.1